MVFRVLKVRHNNPSKAQPLFRFSSAHILFHFIFTLLALFHCKINKCSFFVGLLDINKDIKKQDCPEQIHYIVLLVLTVCKYVNSCDHTVQDGVVMFDKLPSTFDT